MGIFTNPMMVPCLKCHLTNSQGDIFSVFSTSRPALFFHDLTPMMPESKVQFGIFYWIYGSILMVTFTGRGITYYLKYLVLVEPQIISKKQHTKRYLKKQTSSNLNINQLNSQKNTEMPLTSTFMQSGSLPVISYIYITPLIGVKKNVKLIYLWPFIGAQKKLQL